MVERTIATYLDGLRERKPVPAQTR
jgi:hypothetical protein